VIDGFPEGKTGDRHIFAGEMVICQRGTEIAIRSSPVLKLCSQGSVTRKDPPANKKRSFQVHPFRIFGGGFHGKNLGIQDENGIVQV